LTVQPATLFEKIWKRHAVATSHGGDTLLYTDLCLLHEGSNHAFNALHAAQRKVLRPLQVIACADHYVPTHDRKLEFADPSYRAMVEGLEQNATQHGLRLIGMNDPRQGILHIVCPEQGLTQPGMVIVGADSHSSTHGAFGNLSFGIGASELTHVMATQMIWQRLPRTMRVTIDGLVGPGVSAKDLILALIAKIGSGGATGHVIEYAGGAVRSMSMEQRMTLCNMSIEAGGRAGMIAPDDTAYAYLHGRPFAPKDAAWDAALAFWRTLPSDADARYQCEVTLAAADVAPMVSWGTNPQHSAPITGRVPDPTLIADAEMRAEFEKAISYMGLSPGQMLSEIAIDRVFIGSCTNGRIEDMRAAASIAKLGRATVPTWVVPGSSEVKRQAEAEGLDAVFRAANFEWREPGCSMCTSLNGDMLQPGERCASSSNRNFQGRQGIGGRTHLMNPAMAAAAALTGKLTDVRNVVMGAR
jgi:3-isopropylmalate/(R)-2-methylmalate dehydratase large subunit